MADIRERLNADLSDNARRVLARRYLIKDNSGNPIEEPEDMFWRVAHNIAEAELQYGGSEAVVEEWAERFYEAMVKLLFLPNSPTLMNAGRQFQQLSACFVLPVEDSITSIFETLRNTALIHKSGGGTGFSFSRLRPKDDIVSSTKGVSSGPVSFMQVFDAATDAIKQGGTRRGANMAVLRIDHPDILDFIDVKRDESKLTNFNISVAVPDVFMEALAADTTYPLINPRGNEPAGELSARDVFARIVDGAWTIGDPGVVFIDRINRDNPTPALGEIESTNPCGEQPLLPYESCNLGSINLARFVVGEKMHGTIDWDALAATLDIAVRFLDNVIDMNRFPLPEIEAMTKGNRKIGLGVMGFADMLLLLGVPYDSDRAVDIAREVMGFIQEHAREASVKLAEQRGVFPNWDGSVWEKRGLKVRNATTTTIAPTGTISIMAGCSSGVEPLFAVAFSRHVLSGDTLVEVNPIFEDIARDRGIHSPELLVKIADHGTVRGLPEIMPDLQQLFVTAHEIHPDQHVRLQAAFQEFTDNAVSKTINFPNDATREEVARAYQYAYELGCKGCTTYRPNAVTGSVLAAPQAVAPDDGEEPQLPLELPREFGGIVYMTKPLDRPDVLLGQTYKIKWADADHAFYITINDVEKDGRRRPFEIFINSKNMEAYAWTLALTRMISAVFRRGGDVSFVVDELKAVFDPRGGQWMEGHYVPSLLAAIGEVVERHMIAIGFIASRGDTEDQRRAVAVAAEGAPAKRCPRCSSPSFVRLEGCDSCLSCGYSKCG